MPVHRKKLKHSTGDWGAHIVTSVQSECLHARSGRGQEIHPHIAVEEAAGDAHVLYSQSMQQCRETALVSVHQRKAADEVLEFA